MGHFFGNLYKGVRGVVYYRVSHYEQNPFKGIISHGFPNYLRRVSDTIWCVLPPAFFYIGVVEWAKKENAKTKRKNPADYVNDE